MSWQISPLLHIPLSLLISLITFLCIRHFIQPIHTPIKPTIVYAFTLRQKDDKKSLFFSMSLPRVSKVKKGVVPASFPPKRFWRSPKCFSTGTWRGHVDERDSVSARAWAGVGSDVHLSADLHVCAKKSRSEYGNVRTRVFVHMYEYMIYVYTYIYIHIHLHVCMCM